MDTELRDRVVLVTGASGGIGWAVAEAFAAEGCRLVLTGCRRAAELEERVRSHPAGDRMRVEACDTRHPDRIEAVLDRSRSLFGGIDCAVIGAGIWPAEPLALHAMPAERIRQVVEVDLLGAIWTARAFLAGLAATPRSPTSLVFVGSTAGRFGEAGHAAYAASKAALRGLMLTCAHEIVSLDPLGRSNLVEPGWTITPMTTGALDDETRIGQALSTTPLRRVARPEEIASVILFLASPLMAAHLTGQTITAAGGMVGRQIWSPEQIDPRRARRQDHSGGPV